MRSLILERARDLFVREGRRGFSMRKLAAMIDCSPGAIYLHFEDKEALFHCLVEESFARLLTALQRVREGHLRDPVKLLKRGLRIYVDFGLRHPNDYRLAFLLPVPATGPSYKPHAAFEVLREFVARCQKEGRFARGNAERTSQALWAAVHGITSLLIERPTFPWVAKSRLIDQVIDNAVDSLVIRRKGGSRARFD